MALLNSYRESTAGISSIKLYLTLGVVLVRFDSQNINSSPLAN